MFITGAQPIADARGRLFSATQAMERVTSIAPAQETANAQPIVAMIPCTTAGALLAFLTA